MVESIGENSSMIRYVTKLYYETNCLETPIKESDSVKLDHTDFPLYIQKAIISLNSRST